MTKRQSQMEGDTSSEAEDAPSPRTTTVEHALGGDGADTGTTASGRTSQISLFDMELNNRTDPRLLLQAIQMQQGQANQLRAQLREVQRDLADHENTVNKSSSHRKSRTKRPSKRRRTDQDTEDANTANEDDQEEPDSLIVSKADEDQLMQAGRRAFVTMLPWVSTRLLAEEVDEGYDETQRFTSAPSRVNGLRKDALMCIPTHLRDLMPTRPDMRFFFRKGVSTLRSNTRTRLRNMISTSILVQVNAHLGSAMSSADFKCATKRFDCFRHLIGYHEETRSYDSWDTAVLHENWSPSFSREHAFLNRLPMLIFVAIIRGVAAAEAFAEPHKNIAVQANDSQDKILALDQVTPGAIATSIMLARWVLSSDDQLQETGLSTKIDYMAVYEEYLEKLVTGLAQRHTVILNIFRTWNREIFPHAAPTRAGTANQAAAEEKSRRVAELFAEEREGDDTPGLGEAERDNSAQLAIGGSRESSHRGPELEGSARETSPVVADSAGRRDKSTRCRGK
ncbi:hypothetical protein HDZ31DRAFT_76662 [Schizophyllum fasciatum]